MPKQFLVLGIFSGAVAAIASIFFAYIFNQNLFDFSSVLPYWKIISVDLSLALIAVGVFYGLYKVSSTYFRTIFNCLFALCSIVSVIIPITAKFEGLQFPEFYPTFALPLHLFFSVIFLSLSSIFLKDEK